MNIVTIAAHKNGEDGIDGISSQKDLDLVKSSRARHYRDSGLMNARAKCETCSARVKENLEAISQETSRGADLRAFREFTKICVAHDEALWNECTKPQWARLRMNLYCGKQRAFANVLNQMSALKGDKSQRRVIAYRAGRRVSKKEAYLLHRQERPRSAHTVLSQYL